MADDGLKRAEGLRDVDQYGSRGSDLLRARESESAAKRLSADTVWKGPVDATASLADAYMWEAPHKSTAKGRVTPDNVNDASAGSSAAEMGTRP